MDIRIVYRDILIPVRGLKKSIPTGRKYRITEEKKEEIILAAFRDWFTIKRRCQHADEPSNPLPTSKLNIVLGHLPYAAEERKYIEGQLPIEIEKILNSMHMETVDFGGGFTCAFWGENAYSLRFTRNCVVFRFPRVYRDYKLMTANAYIDDCIKRVSLRLKMSDMFIRKETANLTCTDLLRPDTVDVLTTLLRERFDK
ncbi:hypothetical protein HOV30_gp084 [Erwinia phage Derbicus]|uniref:Uncharacterized protein n=2 Tax=Derbicusvirus derbicus TaxID=2734104 RepID=A0A482IL64_9CAUD|nr:hypothetical protein BIZ82_gp084 [Erwinia phage vB_EamM_EarlPhillipIV]YP_009821128.1 hypothetical protein HOV30_gp084 [Erwinia phage Derbicus]ANZ48934.1 hypothetical protein EARLPHILLIPIV_84 [Erwinia phage vB_EamM_EarlPhillipIV]QBP07510.1 hypothetical protein DERBICUS_84 [Erwinia phage Derbicus]